MRKPLLVIAAVLAATGHAAGAATAATSSISLDGKAELLAGLAVETSVSVTCSAPELTSPITLSVQLQQLQKAGGGDHTVVSGSGVVTNVTCDGTQRQFAVLVRTFAPIGQPLPLFRRGKALATANLFSCSAQTCVSLGSQGFAEVRITG